MVVYDVLILSAAEPLLPAVYRSNEALTIACNYGYDKKAKQALKIAVLTFKTPEDVNSKVDNEYAQQIKIVMRSLQLFRIGSDLG